MPSRTLSAVSRLPTSHVIRQALPRSTGGGKVRIDHVSRRFDQPRGIERQGIDPGGFGDDSLAAPHLLHETARQRSGVAPRMLLPVPLHPAPHRHEGEERCRSSPATPPATATRARHRRAGIRTGIPARRASGRSRSSPSTGERRGTPPGPDRHVRARIRRPFRQAMTAPAVARPKGTSPNTTWSTAMWPRLRWNVWLEIRGHRRGERRSEEDQEVRGHDRARHEAKERERSAEIPKITRGHEEAEDGERPSTDTRTCR